MSTSPITDRLHRLSREQLLGMRRGIEKESLRALPSGALALTPHPAALGAPLTHPCITTDYSESHLELITGAHDRAEDALGELARVHQFVYRTLADPAHGAGDERMWVGSMPCGLPTDETIPLGRYGRSNIGRAKSVYRMGLGHRYGRRMQTISGIHYNWSLPGLDNADYFGLIRNFRRHSFLLLWLFGASPAVCSSFVAGRPHDLQALIDGTMHLPWATSLRMGRLGYQSEAQATLAVSYNSLESYGNSLHGALTQPWPGYEAIGVRNLGGEYNQLSTSLLQIENEFYGTIRPKRVIQTGERPLHALRERGVEYVEVRCMDLDPFVDIGIEAGTTRFLDLFLLHCLLSPSPEDTPEEIAALGRNQHRTAAQGREPGLRLERLDSGASGGVSGGVWREPTLVEWGQEIVDALGPIAQALDSLQGGSAYAEAWRAAQAALSAPETLPSARVLAAMQQDFGGSYTRFVRAQSDAVRDRFLAQPWSAEHQATFAAMAQVSHRRQQAIEEADTLDFETWRLAYLDPKHLVA